MKKILLFMLFSASLFSSCSSDDASAVQSNDDEQNPSEITMNLHVEYSEPILYAFLYAFDDTNYCLYTLMYEDVTEINQPISEGVKFKLRTFDDHPINYEYTLYNSDNTIQFQDTHSGQLDTTLWRTYILQ
ncbi:hypothetical protein GWA97_06555 [Flavobacterium sp. LaA7.5]|nr:hypothetical protein [Flavobacterium salilacus subsp. altitudinum]